MRSAPAAGGAPFRVPDARAGGEAQAARGGSRPAGDTPVSETVEVGGTPGEKESRKAAVDEGRRAASQRKLC